MFRLLYTGWDGTQSTGLSAGDLFDRLGELLADSENLGEALERLLRSGYRGGSREILGLDELVERVRERLRELYARYHLDGLLDKAPGELAEAEDNLRRLTEFVAKYGRLFRGPDGLGLVDAVAVMEKVAALKRLETALHRRDLDGLDPDYVGELIGGEAASSLSALEAMPASLQDAGYLLLRGGREVLSAKGARRLGRLALREIHAQLLSDATGRHRGHARGPTQPEEGATRPYVFGLPLDIDVSATLRHALSRRPRLPLEIKPQDLEVREAAHSTRSSTVLLLDMSWSMSWEGRFAAARKVAMAMESLVRELYPGDHFTVVGFSTRAVKLNPRDLPEVTWNTGDPFTNLQDGLRMAADLLCRNTNRNRNVIIVTDGQPTAFFERGRLFCEWPKTVGGLSTRATVETLREVKRITRKGISINTFMLDESPPLLAFVEKMTAINKGRAFFTTPARLGRFLLVDYVAGRKRVV